MSVSKSDLPQGKSGDSESSSVDSPENGALCYLLLQPEEILIDICNLLDPASLRNLAFSSKFFYEFCLHAKGINIPFPLKYVDLAERLCPIKYNYQCICGRFHKDKNFEDVLEKLKKWPFRVTIDTVECTTYDAWVRRKSDIKDFFEAGGIKQIRNLQEVSSGWTAADGVFLSEFATTFKLQRFSTCKQEVNPPEQLMRDLLRLPVKELRLNWYEGQMSSVALASCSIPTLFSDSLLTLEGLKEIVKVWMKAEGLIEWTLGYDDSNCSAFFMDDEIRSCDYMGVIDRSNPPVFCDFGLGIDQPTTFYLLRDHGNVLSICFAHDETDQYVYFRMCPRNKFPLALRDF